MKKIKAGIFFLAALFFTSALVAQSISDGKKFMYYERFQSAKNVFQKVLAANPNDEEAVYWLGQAEIGLENLAGAKAIYLKRMAAAPNSALILAGVGHVELLEGKTADAKQHFETAISLSQGKSIAVLNAIGFANGNPDSRNGDANYAIEKLRQATQIKKFRDPEVWANLGDAYRKLADGGNAIKAYGEALAIDPNYARAIYRSGRVYQTQGYGQEELYMKYYNDAIAKDAKYAPVYNTLYSYYYQTNVGRSAEFLEKYLSSSDDDPKACSYRASILYAQAKFAEAVKKADECIAAEGASPYVNLYKIKSFAYNRLGDSVNAKSNFEEYFKRQDTSKIEGGDYSAYAALLLKFPGNEVRVGQLVERAVALDTVEVNKAAYLKSLAQAYETQKDYKSAALWYSKILDVKKNYGKTDLYYAGYDYFRAGQFPQAIDIFNKYTVKYPDDIFGYYMIGKSNAGMDSTGAQGLAIPSYEKAIAVGEAAPDKSKVKDQLTGAYRYFIEYYYNVKKDQAKALSYVDKALALDPTDAQLITNRDFISKNDPNAAPKKPAASSKPSPPAKPGSKPAAKPKPAQKK